MKEKFYSAYLLHFKGPLHIGEEGVGVEKVSSFIAHSDTLWSGLVNAWFRLFGNVEGISGFWTGDRSPPFLISSAFPFVRNELFFPKPYGEIPIEKETKEVMTPRDWKNIKKAKFLTKSLFEKWICGDQFYSSDIESIKRNWDLVKSHIKETTTPHVRLGHAAFRSDIYYEGGSYFSGESGLFFLVEFIDPNIRDDFESTLRLLGEEGLGGRRSKGCGIFSFKKLEVNLRLPKTWQKYLTLSLTIPDEELINVLDESYYGLVQRKGWALSPVINEQVRRKSIWMLTEGSVFPMQPKGKVEVVTPPNWPSDVHEIYRYGFAFPIPIK
jgi:CRISPR-associated protein Csm4